MNNDIARNRFCKVIEELENCQGRFQKQTKLLELGFEFFDDEGISEIEEERIAVPETEGQRHLVSFFEGRDDPSMEILGYFITETYSDEVNYPLIRRYFRQANKQLKRLIFYGLKENSWDANLLDALTFFNEFELDLKELIRVYVFTCREAPSKVIFEELARNFYEATRLYGYDAFYDLMQDREITLEKKKIIEELKGLYAELEKGVSF